MDWSGVDYCDVFIRLSFWRHPFTAEHPLLRHWCRDTFLQTWWRNKLILILNGMRVSTFIFLVDQTVFTIWFWMQENTEWMVPKDASSLIYVAVLVNSGEMMVDCTTWDHWTFQSKWMSQFRSANLTEVWRHPCLCIWRRRTTPVKDSGVKTGLFKKAMKEAIYVKMERPDFNQLSLSGSYSAVLSYLRPNSHSNSHHQYRDSHRTSQVWWAVMRVNVRESPPSVHSEEWMKDLSRQTCPSSGRINFTRPSLMSTTHNAI